MKYLIYLLFFCSLCYGEVPVLHLTGDPYSRGIQHGKALQDKIHTNLKEFIDNPKVKNTARVKAFTQHIPQILTFIPEHCIEEMEGVAVGAEVPFEKILMLNLFPEMFHCTGIGVQGEATHDGSLYHVRVLDYGVGKNLQNSAVLMVVKPAQKHAYMSVGYAGFIGTITGMNEKKIAIGEIGGEGYGYWEGVPMAFLMKEVLETCSSLEEAKDLIHTAPRTCEYYYVLSDGNAETMVGIYAIPEELKFIEPGENYALLAPHYLPKNYGDCGENAKFFLTDYTTYHSNSQVRFHDRSNQLIALFNQQPKDCIVLRGFGHPNRYPITVDRIQDAYGSIDHIALQNIIQPPVTNQTNLHNAIFHPSTLEAWISHASSEGVPASLQPYTHFNLKDVLNRL